jgi:hypothetical protein
MEGEFKKLAKALPDMRSVQLSDPDGENPFTKFAHALAEAAKQ